MDGVEVVNGSLSGNFSAYVLQPDLDRPIAAHHAFDDPV